MIKLIKKIWKDSVGSNLIATGILAIISLIYSFVKSITETIDFKSAFISFWTFKIQLWIVIFLLIVLIVVRLVKAKRQFRYENGELELDRQLYLKIREDLLPQNQTIGFLRHNNFAGFSFDDGMLDDIYKFESEKENPNFHFFHPELEQIKNELMDRIEKFTFIIAGETFPTPQGRQTVPPEWEIKQPERFDKVVNDLHTLKNEICSNYDDLITKGRNILKV